MNDRAGARGQRDQGETELRSRCKGATSYGTAPHDRSERRIIAIVPFQQRASNSTVTILIDLQDEAVLAPRHLYTRSDRTHMTTLPPLTVNSSREPLPMIALTGVQLTCRICGQRSVAQSATKVKDVSGEQASSISSGHEGGLWSADADTVTPGIHSAFSEVSLGARTSTMAVLFRRPRAATSSPSFPDSISSSVGSCGAISKRGSASPSAGEKGASMFDCRSTSLGDKPPSRRRTAADRGTVVQRALS